MTKITKEFLQDKAIRMREVLDAKRNEIGLEFHEDEHKYFIFDKNKKMTSQLPSVSKIIKYFEVPFDSIAMSLRKAKGDLEEQKRILKEWEQAGQLSTNLGSSVHYELELSAIAMNGNFKECRKPIFHLQDHQIKISKRMIENGSLFLNNMEERECVLMDTECTMGDIDLGYFGQADMFYLAANREKTNFGIICCDWKTNQPKKFETHFYTKKLIEPFQFFDGHDLNKYKIQLPLYNKLLKAMLKGTEFEDVPILGSVIVHLREDGMTEYKVEPVFQRIVDDINVNMLCFAGV